MRSRISILAFATLGAILLIGSAPACMARAGSNHRGTVHVHHRQAPARSKAHGFGGFAGSNGHSFILGHNYGKGHHYKDNWDKDPFWTPDSY